MSYNIEQANSGYVSLTSGGLVVTTAKEKFKTVNTITFLINGIFKSKSATDNLVFSSGHTSLAASQSCLFGVWLDTDGNVTTTQGPIVATPDPCPVPPTPANRALIGLIKVVCISTGAFIPGTTLTDATGVTTTFINAAIMPGTAQ
jgi:hypothetical protein